MFSYNLADYFLRGFTTESFDEVNNLWLALKQMRNKIWKRKLRLSDNSAALLVDIAQELDRSTTEELLLMARLSSLAAKHHFKKHIRQQKIAYGFKQMFLNYLIWRFANKHSIVVGEEPYSNPGLAIKVYWSIWLLELNFRCTSIGLVEYQAKAIYSLKQAQANETDKRSLIIHIPAFSLYKDAEEIVCRLLPELALYCSDNH